MGGVRKQKDKQVGTHLTGDGDDSRNRRLSVLRGLPWGSDGLRGDRKVTEADEDFLCPSKLRPLSLEDCRGLSSWNSSEMEVRVVVVLAPVDAGTNPRDAPSGLELPLAPDLAEK